jgi:hypothetical protein
MGLFVVPLGRSNDRHYGFCPAMLAKSAICIPENVHTGHVEKLIQSGNTKKAYEFSGTFGDKVFLGSPVAVDVFFGIDRKIVIL